MTPRAAALVISRIALLGSGMTFTVRSVVADPTVTGSVYIPFSIMGGLKKVVCTDPAQLVSPGMGSPGGTNVLDSMCKKMGMLLLVASANAPPLPETGVPQLPVPAVFVITLNALLLLLKSELVSKPKSNATKNGLG